MPHGCVAYCQPFTVARHIAAAANEAAKIEHIPTTLAPHARTFRHAYRSYQSAGTSS